MHIPDGFLATPVAAAAAAISGPAVWMAARRARASFDEGRIPMMGVLGAFVFAAQMVNFPLGVGSSGHLVGAMLLAATLGPAAAVVTMTGILALQALVFQDGGLLALGANVLNMGVAGPLAGFFIWRALGGGRAGLLLGGCSSVAVSALLCLAELNLSGVHMGGPALSFALAAFALNAAAEGILTVSVAGALDRIRPGWMHSPATARRPVMAFVLGVSLVLASAGLLLASTAPDGLERMIQTLGLMPHNGPAFHAPLAEYEPGWAAAGRAGRAVAGLAGLALASGLCFALARWIARWRNA